MLQPTLLHQYGVQNSKTSGFGGRVTALHLTEKFSPTHCKNQQYKCVRLAAKSTVCLAGSGRTASTAESAARGTRTRIGD